MKVLHFNIVWMSDMSILRSPPCTSSESVILFHFLPVSRTSIVLRARFIVSVVCSIVSSASPHKPSERSRAPHCTFHNSCNFCFISMFLSQVFYFSTFEEQSPYCTFLFYFILIFSSLLYMPA
jgi:hypothetical protein